VLYDIGINLSADLVDAPTGSTATKNKVPVAAATESGDLDLQARLDNLRKN